MICLFIHNIEKVWIRLWQNNKTKAKCVKRYVAYKHKKKLYNDYWCNLLPICIKQREHQIR